MAVITNDKEYEHAKAELVDMEEFLARTHRDNPNPEHGLTKRGIRLMIGRIQRELGQYEAELSVKAAGERRQAAPSTSAAAELRLASDEAVS
jgi:hypothetical protein